MSLINVKRLFLGLLVAFAACQLHVIHANPSADLAKKAERSFAIPGLVGSKLQVGNAKAALKAWAYKHRVGLAVTGCALVYCAGMIALHKPKTVSEALGVLSLHASLALKDAQFFKGQ